jgi:SAM-dependent methyltransferase
MAEPRRAALSPASESAIPFHYRYFVEHAARAAGAVLDYGCGSGAAVAHGLAHGLDIWGVDTFAQDPIDWGANVVTQARPRISRIIGDRAPFPDRHFAFVFCNQVLEHVADPAALIDDVHRLLRPGGVFMASFPVEETWYEGHIGLYFAHRLAAWPRLRRRYFELCHGIGAGLSRQGRTRAEWVDFFEGYLDRYCFYVPGRRVLGLLEAQFGAPADDLAADYMRTRLAGAVAQLPSRADGLLRLICHIRVGLIIRVWRPAEPDRRAAPHAQ